MPIPFYLSRRLHWLCLLLLIAFVPSARVHAASVGLSLSISDNRGSVVAGSDLTYTIIVRNTSGSTLTGVTLDGFVPTNTSFVGVSDTPVDLGSGHYRWSFTSVANGATIYRYLTVHVNSGLPQGTLITANAQIDDVPTGSPRSAQDTTLVVVPTIALTPDTSLAFADTRVGSTSAGQNVQMKNTGSADLQLQSIVTSGDFAQTSACPATLAPNQTCVVTITFTPSASGLRSGALTVLSDAAASPHSVSLSGTGTSPVATFSANGLTFGPQFVGTTSAAQGLTLTNSGTAPLVIASVALPAGAFAQTNNCPVSPATLAVGASCGFSVAFSPSSAGAASATLVITTDGGNQSIALSGTGVDPRASLAPTSLTFSGTTVGATSPIQSLTLTNNGTSPLTISGIQVTGDFSQSNTCPTAPATLAPNATCSIAITFTPTAVGTRYGQVRVADDAANSPQTVDLVGTGQAAGLSLDRTQVDFGGVTLGATSSAQQVMVSNSGTAALTISGIVTTGDFTQTNTCPIAPATLAANATCSISVRFTPTTAGSRGGSVRISSDAPGTPHLIVLAGNGLTPTPDATFDRASIDFGSLVYGATSASQAILLTNNGTAALSISGISASGDFAIATTTCPVASATLAIGANCQISLTFTPTAGGARTGSLSVVDNAPGSPQGVALGGTGLAARYLSNPGIGNLRMSSVIGGSSSVTIALTNPGTALLTVSAPAQTVSAPFSLSTTAAFTVAAGANASLVLTCTPTAAGPFSQTLTYTTNDPAQPTATYTVTCDGTTVATAGYASAPAPGSTLAIGAVPANQSGSATLAVSESGTAALTVNLGGLSGANASSFSVRALPVSIADGGTAQTLVVTCRPQAAGPLTATLALATNDPAQPTVRYTLTCTGIGQPTFYAFVPMVGRPVLPADLVVASLSVTPTTLKTGAMVSISAVIKNSGETAATGFWVDLYINPNVVPTGANVAWQETCANLVPCYGLAWYVESLEPGASITLTSNAGSFRSAYSNWENTLAAGTTDIYLYVDSWNRDTASGTANPNGAVTESDETNNRAEVHGIQVSVSGNRVRVNEPLTIPARPRTP